MIIKNKIRKSENGHDVVDINVLSNIFDAYTKPYSFTVHVPATTI